MPNGGIVPVELSNYLVKLSLRCKRPLRTRGDGMSIELQSELAHAGPAGSRLDEEIHRALLSRIHAGTYALGSRLPTELDLCEEFKVSRPVIRVALARLRAAGLIESKRGSGSYVTAGTAGDASGYSPFASIADIAKYYEFRITIESRSAALAAGRIDRRQIAALHEILGEIDAEIEQGILPGQSDLAFHLLIAEISGNRFIAESLQMLRPHIFFVGRFVRSISPSGNLGRKRDMRMEHRRIVEALERGDAEAAARGMAQHIQASEKRIFKGE